jgi:hypothetical protein
VANFVQWVFNQLKYLRDKKVVPWCLCGIFVPLQPTVDMLRAVPLALLAHHKQIPLKPSCWQEGTAFV